MRRLINTKLFKLLEQSENESETGDLHFRLAYDEFVNRVSDLCTSRENPMANLFTLAYTRLELKSHQCRQSTQGAEKKRTDCRLAEQKPVNLGTRKRIGTFLELYTLYL